MTEAQDEALSPLEMRRAKLRAWTDKVLEAIEAIPMPESFLEGERALRCSATADKVLNQLYGMASAPPEQPAFIVSAPRLSGPRTATPRPVTARPSAPVPEPAPIPAPQPRAASIAAFDGDEDDMDAVMDWLDATDEANPAQTAEDERSRQFQNALTTLEDLIARGAEVLTAPLPGGTKFSNLPLERPPP